MMRAPPSATRLAGPVWLELLDEGALVLEVFEEKDEDWEEVEDVPVEDAEVPALVEAPAAWLVLEPAAPTIETAETVEEEVVELAAVTSIRSV